MLDKVKQVYGDFQLKRESSQLERNRKDPDIHGPVKIGILYDATVKEDFMMVREFFRDLKECGKYPVSLGYIDFKEPLSFHPLARPEADYFLKSQLNWFQKPACPVVDNFIKEPFDILINLTLKDTYPLDYIAALSRAGVKVGRANSAVSFCYDMSFFLEEGSDLQSFAYIIVHYLNQINANSTQRNRSRHHHTV